MTKQVYCDSEIGTLKSLIVHRPDPGIGRISPLRAEELLFDDIVYLPKMQEEHDIYTKVLKFFLPEENVLFTHDLIETALGSDAEKKQEMLQMVVDFEELPQSSFNLLANMEDAELANVLVSGYYEKEDISFFDPVPNFLFTRDIAVTIKDHVLITKAAKRARQRENILTRYIFYAYPNFESLRNENRIINLNNIEIFPPSQAGESVNIEGGDIMMFHPDYLLIGHSERTNKYAFELVKKAIFEKKLVKHIVQVHIPHERSYMHIDTLFTLIDEKDIACHKPIIYDGISSNVTVYQDSGSSRSYASLKEFLLKEISPDMNFIFSGNGISPYQEREQWTDGCNLLAIKPGVALAYDRNIHTSTAFKAAGYDVINAEEFLIKVKEEGLKPEDITKTIINLSSFELSRGRGGSHCMSCPIHREKI